MTPYRERREQGHYNAEGEATGATTTDDLAGLGAPRPEPVEEETNDDVPDQ